MNSHMGVASASRRYFLTRSIWRVRKSLSGSCGQKKSGVGHALAASLLAAGSECRGVRASYRSEGEDDGHLLAVGLHDLGVDRGNIGDELELTGLKQLGDWRSEAAAAGQNQSTGGGVGRQV